MQYTAIYVVDVGASWPADRLPTGPASAPGQEWRFFLHFTSSFSAPSSNDIFASLASLRFSFLISFSSEVVFRLLISAKSPFCFSLSSFFRLVRSPRSLQPLTSAFCFFLGRSLASPFTGSPTTTLVVCDCPTSTSSSGPSTGPRKNRA